MIFKKIVKLLIVRYKLLGKKVYLKNNCNVSLNSLFEGKNKINSHTIISNSFIGLGSYIGDNCVIANTKIGRYCSIANNVKFVVGNHPSSKFISTHPAFFSTKKQAGFTYIKKQKFSEIVNYENENYSVIVGNDVWIGDGAIILGNVKIGDGAIVGAGAVVTKDIEPYSINVGCPSKKIKYRFDDDYISFLCDFKWWDKKESWLIKNVDYFDDVEIFIKEFKR